jgi:hypothetical protein
VTTCESDTSKVIRPALGQHKERPLVVSGKAGTMNHRRAWLVHGNFEGWYNCGQLGLVPA